MGAGLSGSGLADMLGSMAGLVDAGARHQQAERERRRQAVAESAAAAPPRPGDVNVRASRAVTVWRSGVPAGDPGEVSPPRLPHPAQLALEVGDLVAVAGRELERQLGGGGVHRVGEVVDQRGEVGRRHGTGGA